MQTFSTRNPRFLPVLAVTADPFTGPPALHRHLEAHLSEFCELHVLPLMQGMPGHTLPTYHKASERERLAERFRRLPQGFFVLAEGSGGLWVMESLICVRERVRGMIWCNPGVGLGNSRVLSFAMGLLGFLPWLLPIFERLLFPEAAHRPSPTRAPSVSAREKVRFLRILARHQGLAHLRQNSFPVLLLSGDRISPQHRLRTEEIHKALPHSELIRFADLGTDLLWKKPKLMMHFLGDFLEENEMETKRLPGLRRKMGEDVTLT